MAAKLEDRIPGSRGPGDLSAGPLSIAPLDGRPLECREWNEFVHRHPDGRLFHLAEWHTAIEESFGYRPCHLLARREDRLVGLLPLFRVHAPFVGDWLVSAPFAPEAGALAEDADVEHELLEGARSVAGDLRARYVEIRRRGLEDGAGTWRTDLHSSFSLELPDDPAGVLPRLPREARRLYRRARDAGLSLRDEPGSLRLFYRLFERSVRDLGTPVFPWRLFKGLCDRFGDAARLHVVYHGRQPISGVLSFQHHDTLLAYYASSSPEARRLRAHSFMYPELMMRAVAQGFRTFDMGRSKVGFGSYHFKRHLGLVEQPLASQFLLVRGSHVPSLTPANRRFRPFIACWKRLPVAIARLLGPRIVRYFP